LSFLVQNADVRVWFQPRGETGLTLAAVTDASASFDLTPESEDPPFVIANNALYEMRPFNGLRLKGTPKGQINFGGASVQLPIDGDYPEAVATYEPLVERFGGELLATDTIRRTNADILEIAAESQLKERLNEVSGGTMTCTLDPRCTPYDRFAATPACSGVSADVPPLQYEAQEVTHSITPNDNDLPKTELSVSMAIDRTKITTRSAIKDIRTTDAPSEPDNIEQIRQDYTFGPGSP
jgi:hypothetical protein